MLTVKYILIILHADNNGEKGTFSTYFLLSCYVSLGWLIANKDPDFLPCFDIINRDPCEISFIEIKRFRSGELNSSSRHSLYYASRAIELLTELFSQS